MTYDYVDIGVRPKNYRSGFINLLSIDHFEVRHDKIVSLLTILHPLVESVRSSLGQCQYVNLREISHQLTKILNVNSQSIFDDRDDIWTTFWNILNGGDLVFCKVENAKNCEHVFVYKETSTIEDLLKFLI